MKRYSNYDKYCSSRDIVLCSQWRLMIGPYSSTFISWMGADMLGNNSMFVQEKAYFKNKLYQNVFSIKWIMKNSGQSKVIHLRKNRCQNHWEMVKYFSKNCLCSYRSLTDHCLTKKMLIMLSVWFWCMCM